jgi:predicted metallo-beta-lactamase superfamily hydrolase
MFRPRSYLDDAPKGIQSTWEEERMVRLYEDPACFGASVSSAEELTDREPERWETERDEMEKAEDRWLMDNEGRVY